MVIRDADPSRDAAACAEIYAPYVLHTAISFEYVPPTAAEFAARIERITRSYPWLVADLDGRTVGYAYGSRHHERAAYRWSADVAVYLAGDAKRRGVGRALYETLLDLLARQGVQVACAGIGLPNDASVALHESVGFVPVGVYRRIGFKHGRWHDVGWWQRELLRSDGAEPPELTAPLRLGPDVDRTHDRDRDRN
jgi:phosphinothricin acetyltransferase